MRRVKANKGGDDGMTIGGIRTVHQHWPAIREQLLTGTRTPVRRWKSLADRGVRRFGIPTVLDRFIQQAALQVLQRRWDRRSQHSYGFRLGRSAQQVGTGAAPHRRRLRLRSISIWKHSSIE
jgi:RNA-directed DNA polymerase